MDLVNKLISDQKFQKMLAQIKEKEKNRVFCKHDFSHLLDVARIAYILYLENKDQYAEVDVYDKGEVKEIIYLAALLHDLGRYEEYLDSAKDHAIESEKIAEQILTELGVEEKKKHLICECILYHRKDKRTGFTSMFYQADKLSRNCYLCQAKGCHKRKQGNKFLQY